MIKIGNALRNEIEKVALSGKTLASFARKKAVQQTLLRQAYRVLTGHQSIARTKYMAEDLGKERGAINKALAQSRKQISTEPIRKEAIRQAREKRLFSKFVIGSVKKPVKKPGLNLIN